jgi:hypothetical protein
VAERRRPAPIAADRAQATAASACPAGDPYLLYCDHVERDGIVLFEQACNHDLAGVVAKRRDGAYLPGAETDWLKIRNRSYSQWIGREELFERERKSDPDAAAGAWSRCVLACEAVPADFL